ncbi:MULTISPECIES: aldo/keto reductase [unclassified Luteimonas]|uniref:aldo/keto reductase n=1 Tax=unclassified Luteimonas TaxID=2629088 RepID=UPI0018F08AB1|nr:MULTISPECIES: aldo/keto reductase [unclassified Luteimonas]MBJ6979355.1 aldo/keto reductase [Luteimonas sp. MC1895]MBJ6984430.1 aldo/keto reductase [Luteimonas sp. MC1750]QQO04954.1 aldo/keto reductase [Luteimonas sp. MC1750]
MKTRKLGRSGPDVAPLVLGGNVFGWTADEATSFALLDRFVERGFNAIDTADVYSAWAPGLSGGESETVIGRWLAARGRRDRVVLMTKVGKWAPRTGLSAANIEAAVEDSLRRLRTDHLDVYFAHADDASVPLQETLAAFSRLVDAGKVRTVGASNYDAPRLREALAVSEDQGLARYEVLQPGYNLYDRAGYESALAAVADAHALGVVSYFSLASGFLTGKYRRVEDLAGSARAGFLGGYFDARGLALLDALRGVADAVSATPAQVALAWLMAQPRVTPIASATRLDQLEDIMAAADLVLPASAHEALDAASRPAS